MYYEQPSIKSVIKTAVANRKNEIKMAVDAVIMLAGFYLVYGAMFVIFG